MLVKFKLQNGEIKELMPILKHYTVNDFMGKPMYGLAIMLYAKNEDTGEYNTQYTCATVSFGEFIGMKNAAYIDLNNCPFAEEFLNQRFAEDTGFYKKSGFCTYPLWVFKEDFLKNIGLEEYLKYSEQYE